MSAWAPFPKGAQNIVISFSGHVTINLSREQALRITPGTPIQLTGRPICSPSNDIMTDVFKGGSSFATIHLKADFHSFGFLQIPDIKCRIGGI